MSKVSISGNASGTGVFTIQAPNSNVDRVLSLPDEAGTVLTTAGVPASAMPAGSVIQVVNSILTDTMTWTGTTAIQTILSASITPSSASNKILVQCHVQAAAQSGMPNILNFTMDRSGTKIAKVTAAGAAGAAAAWATYGGPSYTDSGRLTMFYSLNFLDTPATTSSRTYTLGGKLDQGANTAYIGRWSLNNDAASVTTLTLMEIAA